MSLDVKKPVFPRLAAGAAGPSPILEVATFDARDLSLDAGQIIRLTDTGAYYVLHEETQAGIMQGRKEYVSPYVANKTLEFVDAIDGDVVPATVGTNFGNVASGGGTVTTDGTKVTCSTVGQAGAALAHVNWTHGLSGGNWLLQGYFEVVVNTVNTASTNCYIAIEDGTDMVLFGFAFFSSGRWTVLNGSNQLNGFAVNSIADAFPVPFEGTERFLEIYLEASRGAYVAIGNAGKPDGVFSDISLPAPLAGNRIIIGDSTSGTSGNSITMREVVIGRYS